MKLIGKNIKGATFEHELAGVTIFSGANWSGKSTRIEAAQLAIAGYVPGVSEKQNVIYEEFATGNPMSVLFENGRLSSAREWKMENGKTKYDAIFSEAPLGTFPRVAIDYAEFFGLSGPERAKFLFARAKLPDSMTVKAFTHTIIANLKNVKLEENTPATEAVIAATADYVRERQQMSPQEWLANLIVDAKVKLNGAVASAKRMEQTLQGMTLVAGESTVSADCEAKCVEARQKLYEANKTRTRLASELDSCRDEYRNTQAAAAKATGEESWRARLAELSQQKEAAFKACLVAPMSLVDAMTRYETARQNWTSTIDKLKEYGSKVELRQTGIAVAKKGGKCPECGQAIKPAAKRAAAIARELKALQKTLPTLEQAQRDACEKMNAALKARDEIQKANEVYNVAQAEFRRLSLEHSDVQAKLAATETAHAAQLKLPELVNRGEALKVMLESADKEANEEATAYDTLAAQVQLLNAERGKAQQRALVIEDCAKSRAEVSVLKELCKLLTELQAQLLNQVVGPLIDKINEFCRALLRSQFEYRDGEIGFAGTRYGHKTMSGTEKTIFYAAASYALAQDAPLKIVILDEFDIDEVNWTSLVEKLCMLHETGKIDCALLAHTTAPTLAAPNLKIIAL